MPNKPVILTQEEWDRLLSLLEMLGSQPDVEHLAIKIANQAQ
jgi:hypothetical protein